MPGYRFYFLDERSFVFRVLVSRLPYMALLIADLAFRCHKGHDWVNNKLWEVPENGCCMRQMHQ